MRILIVEDDLKTAGSVRSVLGSEGYQVKMVHRGDEAREIIVHHDYEVVILDWMLPGLNGLDLLKEIKRREKRPSVILLTARDAVEDRVAGLDAGADDYLVKPFAFAELLARLRAIGRRTHQVNRHHHRFGELEINLISRQVLCRGREIQLTPKEFEILVYLVKDPECAVTRQMLADEVWKESSRSTPLDNVIDVHLARLRRKLADARCRATIKTMRGVGFQLAPETP